MTKLSHEAVIIPKHLQSSEVDSLNAEKKPDKAPHPAKNSVRTLSWQVYPMPLSWDLFPSLFVFISFGKAERYE